MTLAEPQTSANASATWACVAALLWVGLHAGPAVAEESAATDTLSVDEAHELVSSHLLRSDRWYMRGVNYFWGSSSDEEDAEDARPVRIDDAYREYAGLRIRHIWILAREAFGTVVVDSTESGSAGDGDRFDTQAGGVGRFLNSLATTTRDSRIRQYLRFTEGDVIDPFAFGDSQRMLRERSYITDASIVVLPLDDEPGMADVFVLTRDRWPIGLKFRLKSSTKYDSELYYRNIGGIGLNLEYKVPIETQKSPPVGHRVTTSMENLAGTFLDLRFQFETKWDRKRTSATVGRGFIHPDIRVIGGLGYEKNTDRNNALLPPDRDLTIQTLDGWIGYGLRVRDADAYGRRRVRLIPAVRAVHREFFAPPREFAGHDDDWRDSNTYLGQLTLNGIENYTARWVYSFGETEDIRTGFWLGLTGGYERSELRDRSYAGLRGSWAHFRNRESLYSMSIAVGGYYDRGKIQDGTVRFGWAGFSSLRRLGSSRLRHFYLLSYTLGVNRRYEDGLRLDRLSFRDLSAEVTGDHRITAEVESMAFTRYALLGFRTAVFGYAAAGFIGDSNEALFDERLDLNLGVGLRLNNPSLVIPTIELRAAFVTSPEGSEFSASVRMTDLDLFRSDLPSPRPDVVSYQ